jgi:ATP-binding cassette subfamily B protein
MVQISSGALRRVTELLDEPVTIADKPDAVELPAVDGDITLENVTFAYDRGRPILRNFNLTVPAGANVAVVGASGAGKSTITNLLMRFWDPQEGRILFGDHDIRDVTIASLRGQIGIVFQETFIFDTTVRENIAIGRLTATDEEIVAAAKGAQLESYVQSLPEGYDTVLGEQGIRMSGGQRQRLAIARVLVRDPRVMILDEPTSALDAETEAAILETLRDVVKGRTTISITHRLSLAASADLIYVIDKGQLVEQGPHAELVQAGGLYQKLYETQIQYSSRGVVAAALGEDELRTIPLFSSLSPEALKVLAGQLRPERYGPGQDVVHQGALGDRMYVIEDGEVDVIVQNGRERRLTTLSKNDFFGEQALLSTAPRTATVRTATTAQLLSLAQKDFQALLQANPELKQAVTDAVAARASARAAAASAAGVTAAPSRPPA